MSENKTNMGDIFKKTTNINSIKSCEGKDENNFNVWSRETKPGDFRFIILSLGITGSGKSSAIRKAKELASLINPIAFRNPWVTEEISHDNIVTNNKNYKTCFDNLNLDIENIISKLEDNTICLDPELLNIHKKLEQCYFKFRMNKDNGEFSTIRREYGFSGKTTRSKMGQPLNKIKRDDSDDNIKQKWKTSDIGKTLQEHEFEEFVRPKAAYHKYPETVFNSDITVYRRITDAINAKKNIVYEATGKKYETIKKIIELAARNCKYKRDSKHAKYIIITTLNIIDPLNASERIKERFLQDLKNYNINKENNPAPRLPTFNIEKLADSNEKIYSNVERLIQHCKCVYNSDNNTYIWNDNENKFCEGVGIDYLLFFNQNEGDFRKKNTYASVVVPLSERSKNLTKLTSNKNIEFNKNDKRKLTSLMNKNICLNNETNKKQKFDTDERKTNDVSNPDKITQTFGSANLAYTEKMKKLKNMRRRGTTTTELTIGDITRQIKNKTIKRGGKQKIKKRKTHKKRKSQQKRKSQRKRKTHKKLK